ncbi:hypothetical protein KC19_8G098300 [Ceratodon purpureus]|uniref:Uncharacterized protein n=1 Tax=Ceratodon purpureus TaxID=3225 RepID=A0A8T0GYZ2_CERPU|nr:hypothetical protein KC19_8G098300 [Ceratodon purpureus]
MEKFGFMAFKVNRRCCSARLPIFVLLVLILHVLVAQSEARALVEEDHAQEKVGVDPRRVARDPRFDDPRHRWDDGWDRGGWNNDGGWDEGGRWNEGGGWNNRPPWAGGDDGGGGGGGGRK